MATIKMNKIRNVETLKTNGNVVYVIRKKNIPHVSWWRNNSDKYYSSVLNDKRSIYAFFDNRSATNCLSFINKYKLINNRYPSDSLDQNDEPGPLYIETDTIFYLQNSCFLNGIGLTGIKTFEYTYCKTFLDKQNVFNLTVSGLDLLEDHLIDYNTQIDHLNYLLTT
jgi:hypothetical protein